MQELTKQKQRIWYNDSLLSLTPEQAFDIQFLQDNDKVVGSAQGRGTTWFIQLEQLQAALRHYRRGGLFGKLVSDHYLYFGWKKSRCYQEYKLLELLADAGVNVPRPIAAKAVKRTFCYQADLLTEKIPNAQDLVSILKTQSMPSVPYRAIGQQIKKMHDAQVNHTDLNIHNILIDKDEKVWLIDFDKCYQQQGESWKSSNLERLKRSFDKENEKHNLGWALDHFETLLAGYQG